MMDSARVTATLREARGRGRRAVAKLARRVLPAATVTLAHVEPGLRLRVNLRRHVMFWSGGLARFEPYTVRALRAAVQPGDRLMDVGANIGFFATLGSRLVGPGGEVIACEPEPENRALLRANLEANGCDNVAVVAAAIGPEPGEAWFSVDAATGATGHLGDAATAGELAVGSGRVRLIPIAVRTIDGLVEELGAAPQVIKMDIEGGEIQALRGAEATLTRHRPVVISELACEQGAEVVPFLEAFGYRMWDLETGRVVTAGEHPFMVVAIPAELVEGERARRIVGAIGG